MKNRDGTFEFNGTMKLIDTYDFNWRDKERKPTNRFLTWWGGVSMINGQKYKIEGPEIEITETNKIHSYFPFFKGRARNKKSEENGGKEF